MSTSYKNHCSMWVPVIKAVFCQSLTQACPSVRNTFLPTKANRFLTKDNLPSNIVHFVSTKKFFYVPTFSSTRPKSLLSRKTRSLLLDSALFFRSEIKAIVARFDLSLWGPTFFIVSFMLESHLRNVRY